MLRPPSHLPAKSMLLFIAALLLAACDSPQPDSTGASGTAAHPTPEQMLSEDSTVGGDEAWRVLFDGESLDGWRGFRSDGVPEGWTVTDDGALHYTTAEGDINQGIMTEEQFSDFDLRFEWRVAPGGNSGVFFHVTEDEDTIWKTGPEYQIVDNAGHPDGQNPVTSAGANYSLYGPEENYANPADEYNDGRIVVRGGHVEHFLNGRSVVEYDLESAEWNERIAESSFSDLPAYGRSGSGHIALQEGGPVWYRNIRIRTLDQID